MNVDLSGKTAIVTGAAHGFGRAIALAFAKRGANVWACDVVETELYETRSLVLAAGGSCTTKVVDVRDQTAVGRFVSNASAVQQRLHILVNNARGVLRQADRPLED